MLLANLLVFCLIGWGTVAVLVSCYGGGMFKDFLNSKFGRTLVAGACGALAPAIPPLVMGDTHTFRIALSSALGFVVASVALHFKSEGAA